MSHGRTVCECGQIISSCRCMAGAHAIEVSRPCTHGKTVVKVSEPKAQLRHDESRLKAIMDALDRPRAYAGPSEAFASPDRDLRWRAVAVLNALTIVEYQQAQLEQDA